MPTKRLDIKTHKKINKLLKASRNKVEYGTFEADGEVITGYYKHDEDYNRFTILNNVAFTSGWLRAAVYNRAPQEFLVFDNNKLLGTFSKEVPGFVSFLALLDPDPPDEKTRKLAKPDIETLIDKNWAELDAANYVGKQDDNLPENAGLQAVIDNEMIFFNYTSIFRGERWGSGWLIKPATVATEYKEEEIKTLRNSRTHCLGQSPQNYYYTRGAKSTAFEEVKKDDRYKKQYSFALLKHLLVFDRKILEQRMKDYLQEEPLLLDELPFYQKEKALAYNKNLIREEMEFYLKNIGIFFKKLPEKEQEMLFNYSKCIPIKKMEFYLNELGFPIPFVKRDKKIKKRPKLPPLARIPDKAMRAKLTAFCKRKIKFLGLYHDQTGKEVSFREHCLRFLVIEHEKFKDTLLGMDDFRHFLINFNRDYVQLKKMQDWFTQNHQDHYPYHLDDVAKRYHEVWKDSFKVMLHNAIQNLQGILKKAVERNPDKEDTLQEYDADVEENVMESIIYVNHGEEKHQLSENLVTQLHKQLRLKIKNLHFHLFKTNYTYFYSDMVCTEKEMETKNHAFITAMKSLLDKFSSELQMCKDQFMQDKNQLSSTKKWSNQFDQAVEEINELFSDLQHCNTTIQSILTLFYAPQCLLNKTLPEIPEIATSIEQDYTELPDQEVELSRLATDDKLMSETLITSLNHWIEKINKKSLPDLIDKAYKAQSESSSLINKSTHRLLSWAFCYPQASKKPISLTECIKNTFKSLLSETHDWDKHSFNIHFIKIICLAMAEAKQSEPITLDLLAEKKIDWWVSVAKNIAEKCELISNNTPKAKII